MHKTAETHQLSAAVFPAAEARLPELLEGPGRPPGAAGQQVEDVGRHPPFRHLMLFADFVPAAWGRCQKTFFLCDLRIR
jgi:hypothetical protein